MEKVRHQGQEVAHENGKYNGKWTKSKIKSLSIYKRTGLNILLSYCNCKQTTGHAWNVNATKEWVLLNYVGFLLFFFVAYNALFIYLNTDRIMTKYFRPPHRTHHIRFFYFFSRKVVDSFHDLVDNRTYEIFFIYLILTKALYAP